MNSTYSILVLRGTQTFRFVVSQKALRRLILVGLNFLAIIALYFSDYQVLQKSQVDEVAAKSEVQKQKLSVLRHRAQEVQESLARWKGMREKISAAVAPRGVTSAHRHEGEELQKILAALDGELKRMIASLPSEWPVRGRVVSGVGMRPSPWTGEMEYHAGLDIPKPIGTPVRAAGAAVVESVDGKLGNIVLNHGQEIKTKYAHLSKIYVHGGEQVGKGQVIAAVGNTGKSTGPHLHYEVRVAGSVIDPRQHLIGATQVD